MNVTIEHVKKAIDACADKAIYSKPMLTLLDNYSGDGDMGISMEKGAQALKKVTTKYNGSDIGKLFGQCARSLNNAASSTMGTLLSAALTMLGNKFAGRDMLTTADLLAIPEHMADAISMRGHAKVGDKTLLDALIPLSETLRDTYQRTGDLHTAVCDAAKASKVAAKNTCGMIATIGRAKWIGERSRDYPDPGAVFCSLMADAIAYPERDFGYKLPNYETK